MKKIFFGLFTFMVLVLASCGNVDYTAINEKLDKEGVYANFSQEEYSNMIDFVDKNQTEAYKSVHNMLNNFDIDSSPSEEDKAMAEKGQRCYIYVMALGYAEDNGKLDSSNSKKFNKVYQKTKELENKYFNQD